MKLLKPGSRGPSVQLLQLALRRAGFGPIETDGIYGPITKYAVMRFQSANGLSADGIAGSSTHRAILPWYTGYLVHTIRRGDTIYNLARLYGSSVHAVNTANPGLTPSNLQIGSQLVIPLPFPVVPTDIAYSAALVAYCVRGLAARYPFITTGEIGKSVLGRPLWYMAMGSGENRVIYNATHHANEWICTPLLLKFAEDLASACASGAELGGQRVSALLAHSSLFLVPCLDPDGMELVTGELQDGDAYTRALAIAARFPQFPFPSGWKANIRGTDLNLQYPAGWEQAKEIKYAQGFTSPAPANFVGTAPLSAPESRAMAEFTRTMDPALTISYHTQGEVIYWRYQDLAAEGSREIAEAFARVSGYAVSEVPYESGYAGYKDWFLQEYRRPGFTIEAGLGENPLPISDFGEIYRKNLGILTLGLMAT